MQTARCFVNIGGEVPHTVPKNNVTPAELALLQAIHGADAVHDVQITGKSTRSNRDERARLAFTYGKAVDNQQRPFIDTLFPGVTSKLPTDFDDLGLPDEMYAAERKAPKPKRHDEDDDDQPSDAKAQAQVAEDTIGRTKGRKGRSTRSSATGTGLKGKADGPDPRAPTGKGGAGSLGSEGGVDGDGHMPPDDDGEDDNDGVKDILD